MTKKELKEILNNKKNWKMFMKLLENEELETANNEIIKIKTERMVKFIKQNSVFPSKKWDLPEETTTNKIKNFKGGK